MSNAQLSALTKDARRHFSASPYTKASPNPNSIDMSVPKFADDDGHVAAVLAQGGFSVLNVEAFRK